MRKKDVLLELDDITILYQFLYLSGDNFITIDNGLAKLEIRMNEKGYFHAKNLNFPGLSDFDYTDMMTISNMLGMIAQLKDVAPVEFPNSFSTRWDEIKSITAMSIAQNKI